MSQEAERIAVLEQVIKANTETLRELNATVRDVVALKRDLDYHRRDIDSAHEGLRSVTDRVDALENKEVVNKWARYAIFAAATALIKLAWDSHIIVQNDRPRDPPAAVVTSGEPK